MFRRILFFYIDGFENLSETGRTLWIIVIIKLVVIFVIIRAFLFPTIDTKIHNKAKLTQLYINQITKTAPIKHKKEK